MPPLTDTVDGEGNALLAYLDADLSGLPIPEQRATAAALERQGHTIDDPKAPAFEGRAEFGGDGLGSARSRAASAAYGL